MKRYIILFLIGGLLYSCSNGKISQRKQFHDSIVIFFIPIFASEMPYDTALIKLSQKPGIKETIFVKHTDYLTIKSFIEHPKRITSKKIGVGEAYIKSNRGELFITQFCPLAKDMDGHPIEMTMDMAYLINKNAKIYNYFEKDEIMLNPLYKSYTFPSDYNFYFNRYANMYKTGESTIDSTFLKIWAGVKILLVDESEK
jgi:hypothetical protein